VNFRGDGHYTKEMNEVGCFTSSKKLSEQLQWMLFRNSYYNYIKDIPSHERDFNNVEGTTITKDSYIVRITGNFSKIFIKECWDKEKL